MKIIGITGGTGAGKSSVCDELKKCGAEIVDCDKIARHVVEKGMPALGEIADVFGNDVLTVDGNLDRKKMGKMVFSDSGKLERLNKITHKHIFAEMEKQINGSCADIVVLDVPLLFQCDFPFHCDITVAVIANKEIRMKRIMERDGISEAEALARMSNQLTEAEYAEFADVCFENDGNREKICEFAKWLCNG